MKTLLVENTAALEQGYRLLSSLGDHHYQQRLPSCFNAAIGGHVRHTLDHYSSFLSGFGSSAIDYEARTRDARLETDRTYAMDVMGSLRDQLTYLPTLDRPLRVRIENSETGDPHAWSSSSARRELQFLLSHTIHHYALIAVSCRLLGVEPPRDFGIAPSTLRHRERITSKVA